MTNYAGETYVITHKARDEDDTRWLTLADVDSVTVEIFDSTGAIVLPVTAMAWSSTTLDWRYKWITGGATPVPAGSYRARVVMNGPGLEQSIEWMKIRLSKEPITV